MQSVFRVSALSACIYALFLLEDSAYTWSLSVFPAGFNKQDTMSQLLALFERCQIPSFLLCTLSSVYLLTVLLADLNGQLKKIMSPISNILLAFVMPMGFLSAINYGVLNVWFKEYLVLHYPYMTTAPLITSLVVHVAPALVGVIEFCQISRGAWLLNSLSIFFTTTVFVFFTFGRMITQDSLLFASQLATASAGSTATEGDVLSALGLGAFKLQENQQTMMLFSVILSLVNVTIFLMMTKMYQLVGCCPKSTGASGTVSASVSASTSGKATKKASAASNDSTASPARKGKASVDRD